MRERGELNDGARSGKSARNGAARFDRGGKMATGAIGLVENALRAFLAAIVGGLFAWWAAPFVAG